MEKLQPNILVTDIQKPGLVGIEVVRQLQQKVPRTRIIVFSMYATDAFVIEAFRFGVGGYILKGVDSTEILEAVRTVNAERRYYCTATPRRLHSLLGTENQAATAAPEDPYESLPSREREVFQLISEGHSNKVVGERVFISPRTVEIYRANAMRKLSLKTQSELIRYAVSRRLISTE